MLRTLICTAQRAGIPHHPCSLAAYFHLRSRRILPCISSVPLRQIVPTEPIHQADKFQQVRYAEKRPLPAQDDLGIGSNNVRPLRGNRANRPLVGLERQGHPIAVVPLAYARQLPSVERMKGMRHAHKTCCCDRSLYILG